MIHDMLRQQTLLKYPISDFLPTNNIVIDHLRRSNMKNIIRTLAQHIYVLHLEEVTLKILNRL